MRGQKDYFMNTNIVFILPAEGFYNFHIFCTTFVQTYNIFLLQKDFRNHVVIHTFKRIFSCEAEALYPLI